MKRQLRTTFGSESGSSLMLMSLAITGLLGLSAGAAMVARSHFESGRADREEMHARYVTQAGLSEGMYQLRRGYPGNVGSVDSPVSLNDSQYWVTANTVGTDMVRLTSTGLDDRSAARMELTVRAVPTTIWRYGAFGHESLHMDANARVDSYNSEAGTYASQATHGSGSDTYANSNGDIGSNGNITMDQNTSVWGDASPGPGHTATLLGFAAVTGSTAPAATELVMPTITVPSFTNLGALTVAADLALGVGDRTYTNMCLNNNRTLTIVGPSNIVMTNLTMRSGSRIVVDATFGPVNLWVIDDFSMSSNAQIHSTDYKPEDIRISLLSDNVINPEVMVDLDLIDFDSNSKIYGTILAPNAAIEIDSNFELFGSILARSIDLDSNARFHFDEALLSATGSGTPTYETICWRELPYAH